MFAQEEADSPPQLFSILIIEDNEEDVVNLIRLMRRSKSEYNFDIRVADSGESGLALCLERLPDCVILDYGLSDLDGLGFLGALNSGRDPENDPICPVVVITCGTIAAVAVRAIKEGAQDYLLKDSLTSERMLLAIENAVEKVGLRRRLREAEARFRSSLDNMLDCFGIYSAVRSADGSVILDFRCEYVNAAACSHSSQANDQHLGRLVRAELLPAQSVRGVFTDYVRLVETGEPLKKIELAYGEREFDEFVEDDGNFIQAFEIRAWKMGDGFAVTWRDITAQRRSDIKLREAEERIALAVDASEAGVVEVDLTNHRIRYTTRTLDLFDIPMQPDLDVVAGKARTFADFPEAVFLERVYAPDRARIEEALRRASDPDDANAGFYHAEYRVVLRDGTQRWISSNGRVAFDATGRRPMRRSGLIYDITQRKSEQQKAQQLAAIVESSEDFVTITTPDHNNLFVNEAALRLVGLASENEPKSRRLLDYFFPEDVANAQETMQRAWVTGHAMVETRFRHFVTKAAIDVSWNLIAIEDSTTRQPYALATVARDIRERKRIEREKDQYLREVQDRADRDPVTGLFNHRVFYSRLYAEAASALRNKTNLAIVMMDLDAFKFFNDEFGHAAGDDILRLVADRLRSVCRPADTLARYGGDEFALLLPNVGGRTAVEIEARLRDALQGLSYSANGHEKAVPVFLGLGAALLTDVNASPDNVLQEADERLRRSKTGGEDEDSARRIRADLGSRLEGFSMLDSLLTAVDNKDRYTRRHSEDVMQYGVMIARELGMDNAAQQEIGVSALLHDVGKIGVPDSILRKPGRLTDKEFDAIKLHPTMGAAIVATVSGLEYTLDAVRHHHERWDGFGYPSGLRENECPLSARLMAVADAYSAMTTDRPYRIGMEAEKARYILESGAGTQWDPACVSAFLEALRPTTQAHDAEGTRSARRS